MIELEEYAAFLKRYPIHTEIFRVGKQEYRYYIEQVHKTAYFGIAEFELSNHACFTIDLWPGPKFVVSLYDEAGGLLGVKDVPDLYGSIVFLVEHGTGYVEPGIYELRVEEYLE